MTQKNKKRIVILAAGKLDAFTAKTAAGIIRYRGDEVVGVINPAHAGQSLEGLIGVGQGIPIVAHLADLDETPPDMLIIGVATPGGQLPDAWREILIESLRRGMEIVNGLHTMLGDDLELVDLARLHGGNIWDVRRSPEQFEVGMARAVATSSNIVLTVGSDCNLGKKIATIEVARELQSRGHDAEFLATGQTGVIISGNGLAIDRVISDFVSGAVEKTVLEHAQHDWLVVEGQGAIFHPSYSSVTLGLMHGACPQAMILCHQPTRDCLRHTDIPIPPLGELVTVHESLMRPIRESKVVGVALNCFDLSEVESQAAVDSTREQLNLPVTDVIRYGAGPLVDSLIEHFNSR